MTDKVQGILTEISENDQLHAYMAGAVGIVEANSYETMNLWKTYNERPEGYKENCSGFLVTAGTFGGWPVCFSLNFATVAGAKILIIEPTSLIVDNGLIEQWLLKYAPLTCRQKGEDRSQYLNMQNAMNFHNVLPR